MSTPPNPLSSLLERQGVVMLDGGLATALETRGQDLVDPLWSAKVLLDEPRAIRAVHDDYLASGADCIATATYQATFEGFARRGLGPTEAEASLLAGVRLAVEARDAFWGELANREGRVRPVVAASIGPFGAFLADGSEYTGRYDLDADGLEAFHRERWAVLASSDADLMACETIPSLVEARALLRLLDRTPDRWAWISFQCRDEAHLADGTPFREAVAACAPHPRVLAVGVNCVPPHRVSELLRRAREVTDGDLVAYPNSGETWDPGMKVWMGPSSSADPVDLVAGWRRSGATLLGGCCRTGPEDVRRMRRALLHPD